MSNIHHFEGFSKPPKILTGADAALPVKPAGGARSLSAINPGMSAIEYIVENAKPGEVIHVDECDYYSKYLWRSYKEFSTRYSCT
jgi:hypothetical protein